jgi:hypothetical protein
MSEQQNPIRPEVLERLRRQSAPESQSISTQQGLDAVAVIAAQAQAQGVAYALAGGLALHLYGFTRATKDVDLVASALLDWLATEALSFGGVMYQVQVGDRLIDVDWIVRDDFFREFYVNALRDAIVTEQGLPILTPEWLVILKYIARRGKDKIDLEWLLQQTGLVDRAQVKQLIIEVMGEKAAVFPIAELEEAFQRADLNQLRDQDAD